MMALFRFIALFTFSHCNNRLESNF